MSIEARIEKDSIGPSGVRLTTFVLRYPRFIHAELMTHRVFSRNASSSRAIPVHRQIENIEKDPAMPIHWGKNQKGMQAYSEHESPEDGQGLWLSALKQAAAHARAMNDLGFHKQIVNRLLEPWAHIHVVLTGTDFSNWFGLRHHHAAQHEIQELARQMWELYDACTPHFISEGEWHLPFVDNEVEQNALDVSLPGQNIYDILLKRSVARCARVSYMNHDGTKPTLEQDLELYDRLLGSQPIHASPAEHQAMAVGDPNVRSGNLTGWVQYRKAIPGENITEFNGPEENNE